MASEQSLRDKPAFIKELLKAGGFEVVKVKCKRVSVDIETTTMRPGQQMPETSPGRLAIHSYFCLGVRLTERSECPLSVILRQVMDEEQGHSDDSVVETGVVVYSLCETLCRPKRSRSGNMIWWPEVRLP